MAEIQLGKMLQTEAASSEDHEVPYMRAGHLSGFPEDGLPKMWASPQDLSRYVVNAGDLVVAEGGDAGRPEFVPSSGDGALIQNSLHRLRPRAGGDVRFLRYALVAVHKSDWLDVLCNRATFGHLTGEKLSSLRIPSPQQHVQRRIATFLDEQTSRIDELITNKQQMIDRLEERRTRLLSERFGAATVTGEHPSGAWPICRLGYVAEISGGLTLGKEFTDATSSYPYLRVANVQDGHLLLDDVKTVEIPRDDVQRYTLRSGDLLVLEGNGNPENLGRGVLWRDEIDPPVLHQNHVHAVRTDSAQLLPEFLEALLRTEWVRHVFTGGSNQVSIATLSQERLASLPISLPDLETQSELLRWWDAERNRTTGATSILANQIDLLQERRRSLITAAVTGEMEVP